MTTPSLLSARLALAAALIGGAILANLTLGGWTHGQELGWVTGLAIAMALAVLAIVLGLPTLFRRVRSRRIALAALCIGALESLICVGLWLRASG
jgi:hypothetical protein